MKKKQAKVRYQPSPNPIETKGNKVMININGSYPAKYFNKNAIVVLQPVLQWEGGSIDLVPMTLKGENVTGENGVTISYKKGGRFTYHDEVDYQPGMETGKIIVNPVAYKGKQTSDDVKFRQDAAQQKGAIELGNAQVAEKINITSLRVSTKGDIAIADHGYLKSEGTAQSANIFFPVNLSNINWDFSLNKEYNSRQRVDELRSSILTQGIPRQINITGWASPEGEESFNVGLSKKRAESATKLINDMIDGAIRDRAKIENINADDLEYYIAMAKKDIVITSNALGEDWDNFIKLVEKSSIPERNAVTNVVRSQTNLRKREQEIRNMSIVFKELSTEILPGLRRSQITFLYTVPKKSDQEIGKLASLDPEKLSFEELMYAAALNYNYASKYRIYKWATENYSSEWSAWSNAAATAFYLGNYSEAERFLNVAKELNPDSPEVLNNLALLAMENGNYELADQYLAKAVAQKSPEASANIAVLKLKTGDYEGANELLAKKECSYNLALSQLMSGNTGSAIKTLDCAVEQTGEIYYLKAIAYSRLDDMQGTLDNLKLACQADEAYKNTALKDVEFTKYWKTAEFQEIVN
ncbi:hypothetical protein LJC16_00110 [Bacteroidales bacterium OttesenSCG-928-C19]|nr:hypothetical protein [Bacteroidales bacterium OttesenSCG-928-C19]